MRGRILRRTLVVSLVFVLAALGSGPAFASPLTGATANAYGIKLDLLGSTVISPTPVQNAGPGINQGADNIIEADLDTTAFAGAVGAKARTTLDSIIEPELPPGNLAVTQGGPAKPSLYNAQGYARAAGAVALASEDPVADLTLDTVRSLLGGVSQILAVDGVSSEALASCVAGQPVIAGGTLLTGVELLGIDLTPSLDGTVNQVVPIVDTVLQTLGASLVANEQTPTPNGLAVNALHLTIPSVIDLIIAHTEVTGVSCAPVTQCSDGIDNDGDGKIDFPADPECDSRDDDSEFPQCSDLIDNDGDGKIDAQDPGCHTDGNANNPASYDPNDNSEADLLPRTGGDNVPLGIAILAGGGLLLLVGRKVRRASAEG